MSHASDLLFFEMVNMAKEYGKGYINLGLGVNPGIRRMNLPVASYRVSEERPLLQKTFCFTLQQAAGNRQV